MKDRLNNLFKRPIKKVYFFSIIAVYLLVTLTNITLSFYTFLAYGQEIKEINTQIGYTLTYNNQGGTGCTNKIQYGNNPWGELCTPTKTGYTFYGWYTEQDGGGTEVTSSTNATGNTTVYADYTTNTLYDVLKRAKKEGTYAREYTGSHQDSMDESLSTKKIYHWYGSDETAGTAILDKNNVIFANHCWQMIRTTDTGGVRMIYNGEPTITVVDGKTQYDCGSTRPGHIGGIKTTQSLSGNYYYGDGYTTSVSGNTTTYTLTNTTQVTINTSNAATAISSIASNYPYTCKKTSSSGTCTTLYKVDSQSSGVNAYVYSSVARDSIGGTVFNSNYNSASDVGYMYNSRYVIGSTSISQTVSMYEKVTLNSSTLTDYSNYYFGDGYTISGSNHVLTNAVKGNTITDYPSSWVGKYMCQSTSSSTCSTIYYIGLIDTSETNPIIYRVTISSGMEYNDSAYKYLFGDSIIDNGNGTFEIFGNVQEVIKRDWITEYSTKANKYVCMPGYYTYDSVNDKYICSDNGSQKVGALRYITETKISNFIASAIYKYGFGIVANGNNYELISNNNEVSTLQYIYNWSNTSNSSCFANVGDSISNCGYKTLSKSHYTCYNLTGVCSTYDYISSTSNSIAYSIQITDGKYVSTDLTDTNNILYLELYQNDENGKVNTTNSTIKGIIDSWYQNTLLTNFDSYIDDTIYCNDRTISNFGGWNPNGGSTYSNSNLQFRNYLSSSGDLSCLNMTDKFSYSNNDAKLTYKVGLISSPELNLLNQQNIWKVVSNYWLFSPYSFSEYANECNVHVGGGIYYCEYGVGCSTGVRPAVSLIPGIEYSSGDGSMANPYVVDTSNN